MPEQAQHLSSLSAGPVTCVDVVEGTGSDKVPTPRPHEVLNKLRGWVLDLDPPPQLRLTGLVSNPSLRALPPTLECAPGLCADDAVGGERAGTLVGLDCVLGVRTELSVHH